MSPVRKIIGKSRRRPDDPIVSRKTAKAGFYLLIALSTIFCILALFSFAYAGSYNPADLFHYTNFTFSYTGTPAYTNLYADKYYVGMSGVNGSVTNMTLRGKSDITLYPAGDITEKLANGSERCLTDTGPYTIGLLPGEAAWVTVGVLRDDDFNYNMRFRYDNTTLKSGDGAAGTDDILRIIRKGNNQYTVNATCPAGAWKTFEVKNEPCWCFPVMIAIGRSTGDPYGVGMDVARTFIYNGQINVSTTGGLWMKSPVSALSPESYNKLELEHAEGILDIKHIEHKCNPADSITIMPVSHTVVSLLNGRIVASGYADALDFREQSFGQPITVIIKEGNFALLTGLLSSFLTIILARLVTTIRRK